MDKNEVKCNICGCSEFDDVSSRRAVRCTDCGALERTRLVWKYLERLKLDSSTRILHLAPERSLYYKLRELAGENYVTAIFSPSRYSLRKTVDRLICVICKGGRQMNLILFCIVM